MRKFRTSAALLFALALVFPPGDAFAKKGGGSVGFGSGRSNTPAFRPSTPSVTRPAPAAPRAAPPKSVGFGTARPAEKPAARPVDVGRTNRAFDVGAQKQRSQEVIQKRELPAAPTKVATPPPAAPVAKAPAPAPVAKAPVTSVPITQPKAKAYDQRAVVKEAPREDPRDRYYDRGYTPPPPVIIYDPPYSPPTTVYVPRPAPSVIYDDPIDVGPVVRSEERREILPAPRVQSPAVQASRGSGITFWGFLKFCFWTLVVLLVGLVVLRWLQSRSEVANYRPNYSLK